MEENKEGMAAARKAFAAARAAIGSVKREGKGQRGNRYVTAAKHQTGFQTSYEVNAVLSASLLVLYDWNGTSAAFAPSLTATPLGSLELTLGAQVFAGSKRSQYGAAERLFFLVAEWFF